MDDDAIGLAFARVSVQDAAEGKDWDGLAAAFTDARAREQRLREEGKPLASRAGQQVVEWQRLIGLVAELEWPAYELALDEQAQAWRTEHDAWVAQAREQAGRLLRKRLGRAQEAELPVHLSGDGWRRLQTLSRQLGVGPDRVLEVPAEHVQAAGGEGLVQVPAVSVAYPLQPGEQGAGSWR
ncbi:hypothetical protein [Streptacidiphilus sp. BW17]|uniref:hypothetical protein n=1 Tax=Streptacidiphilus sp. BW17 TaxID=3156274 RepID=UPI0035149E21